MRLQKAKILKNVEKKYFVRLSLFENFRIFTSQNVLHPQLQC
ncbi:hypothetical protein [Helicobacter typhlonius]|uniref:Uncharacterized protein n=1 Tax=Helicobacter typhlonius TaxID=76936 RepID=A0A0S4PT98_9HELI|nr:Hypothetical protein BN2458_PEG0633 [Helicobacter typhlonius]